MFANAFRRTKAVIQTELGGLKVCLVRASNKEGHAIDQLHIKCSWYHFLHLLCTHSDKHIGAYERNNGMKVLFPKAFFCIRIRCFLAQSML